MTRSSLRRATRRIYAVLTLLLLISLVAKAADHIPALTGTRPGAILKDVYEYLKDMSLLIATCGVAYISNMYQRRQAFLDSLKAEWRDIIASKTALLTFMHKAAPTHDEYLSAYTRLSETIDNMRIVYRNVGETDDLIGLYPYAPLHDMRRVLQTLDPRDAGADEMDRKLARDTMLRSFYALREYFLEELDLEEPDHAILPSGARRLQIDGARKSARDAQQRQVKEYSKAANPKDQDAKGSGADDPGDVLLKTLYAREMSKRNGGKG
jgi:hypothetical protein